MIFKIIAFAAILFYAMLLHKHKNELNDWLDAFGPGWYTTCRFCRGIEFAFPLWVGFTLWVLWVIGVL